MSTVYSTQYAKNINVYDNIPMDKGYEGEVKFIHDTYTLSADLASSDQIVFGKLPKGAKVIDCIVTWTDLDTSGGTIDVGITGALSGLHSNLDVTSAGSARLSVTTGVYSVATAADLIVSIDGDTDATSGTITVTCLYI